MKICSELKEKQLILQRGLNLADLGVEGAPRVAEVLCVTQDEAGQDLLFLDALQPQLEVLARPGVVRLHVV